MKPPKAPGDAHVVDDSGKMSQPWLEYLKSAGGSSLGLGDYRQSWNDNLGDNWLLCDGRTIETLKYPALYNLLAKRYGGTDTTFGVPSIGPVFSKGMGSGENSTDRPALYTFIRAI